MKGTSRLATLLLIAGWSAGCPWPFPEVNPCQQVALWPRVLSVSVVGAPLSGNAAASGVQRRSLLLVLTEPPGLMLLHSGPGVRRTFCTRISREEFDSCVANAETLLQEPERFFFEQNVDREYGEAIAVGHRQGQPIIEVEDLSPKGLEATEEIWCLAVRAFGQRALDAIRATSPGYADRADLGAACADRGGESPGETEKLRP